MTEISEKLNEAMKAKKNDIKSFVWKLAKKSDRTQEEILLVDATSEQLNSFYNHCLCCDATDYFSSLLRMYSSYSAISRSPICDKPYCSSC